MRNFSKINLNVLLKKIEYDNFDINLENERK